jgi:hypothetical protein
MGTAIGLGTGYTGADLRKAARDRVMRARFGVFWRWQRSMTALFPVSDCETDRPNCLRRISGSS